MFLKKFFAVLYFPPDRPEVDIMEQNLTVLHGDNLTLQCSVAGHPRPTAKWILPNINPQYEIEVSVPTTKKINKKYWIVSTHKYYTAVSYIVFCVFSPQQSDTFDTEMIFLHLFNISSGFNKRDVTCWAENMAGSTKKFVQLDVRCE